MQGEHYFAKIYRSMWTGTLVGKWEAWSLLVFMLVHANEDGLMNIHPAAISAISGMPLDSVLMAIQILEAPDPNSRTNAEEGRRIVRADDHRDWGWYIVNYHAYRDYRSPTAAKARAKDRQQRFRDRQAGVVPQCVYCGSSASTVDHVIPISSGGWDGDDNLVDCCMPCNQSKRAKSVVEFLNNPGSRRIRPDLVLANPILNRIVAQDGGLWAVRDDYRPGAGDSPSNGIRNAPRYADDATGDERALEGEVDSENRDNKPSGPSAPRATEPVGFAEFWKAYPTKVGKKAAASAFKKAVRLTTVETMLGAIESQKRSKRWTEGYIPNPATWLNQGRWDDEFQSTGVTGSAAVDEFMKGGVH